MRNLIPFALIALGIFLIVRRKQQHDRMEAHSRHYGSPPGPSPPPSPPFTTPSSTAEDPAQAQASFASATTDTGDRQGSSTEDQTATAAGKIRYSKGLGDMTIDCNGMLLHNVEVSSGLGDVELRLHGGQLRPGLNRVVISGFVGDIKVLAPRNMELFAHCSNFIGDIDVLGRRASGFNNNMDAHTPQYNSAEMKVYIAANSLLGDIRIEVI
jgi:hypothetical protein